MGYERCVNTVTLLGRLGKDAECSYLPSGAAVVMWSMATTRYWKTDKGELKSETDWHNCVLWHGEKTIPYLTKGARVCVLGSLRKRSYETKTGHRGSVTEIVVSELVFLSPSKPVSHPAPDPGSDSVDSAASGFGVGDEDVPL